MSDRNDDPMTIETVRTRESAFQGLPDFPYAPHYAEIDGIRIHYVDEGPADGGVILLMHGEPTWSFLYRKMIPVLTAAGYRAVAPDLVGFGRSDKPLRKSDYTYQRHVDWMTAWLQHMDLRDATLVGQDWGSLIGLRLAVENEERFSRIVMANGALPTGDERLPGVFRIWRAFSQYSPWFPVGRIVQAGCRRSLPRDARRAYEAPFPDRRYKAGARAFPALVPSSPHDPATVANRAAWQRLEAWEKPFLCLYATGDPITRPMYEVFQRRVPGARGQPHELLRGAGHFIQEDRGPDLARRIADWCDQGA